jgi:hypothetical protein
VPRTGNWRGRSIVEASDLNPSARPMPPYVTS